MNEEYLCFIKYVGQDSEEYNIYEFMFTDNIDEFWGDDFEIVPCCLCNNLTPHEEYITTIKTLKTKLILKTAQESCCFSFQDAIDRIIAIGYESLENYDFYPEDGRLVFSFGMPYEDCIEILNIKQLNLE